MRGKKKVASMMHVRKMSGIQRFIRGTEMPIVYSLTVFSAVVSMLVYGNTLLRSDGALFDFLKPVFGAPYALTMAAVLIALLAVNRRTKVLIVLGLGELLHLLISFSPTGERAFDIAEHLNTSVVIAYLLATSCIHFALVEEPERR